MNLEHKKEAFGTSMLVSSIFLPYHIVMNKPGYGRVREP
jgi:hypothetical protein